MLKLEIYHSKLTVLEEEIGNTSSINVYYEAGGADTIDNLSVQEAHYILDFLRNEKPMDYDHSRRRFLSGAVEPVKANNSLKSTD
ncbi:MAG: hypothetical protein Kow00121_34440 [Elainellaceae cyanobacterium]